MKKQTQFLDVITILGKVSSIVQYFIFGSFIILLILQFHVVHLCRRQT